MTAPNTNMAIIYFSILVKCKMFDIRLYLAYFHHTYTKYIFSQFEDTNIYVIITITMWYYCFDSETVVSYVCTIVLSEGQMVAVEK